MSLISSSFLGSNPSIISISQIILSHKLRRWIHQIFNSTWSWIIWCSNWRFDMEKVTSSKFISCRLSMWCSKIASKITFSCSSLKIDSINHYSSQHLLKKLSTSRFFMFLHSINSFNKSHETPVKSISIPYRAILTIRHRHRVLIDKQFALIYASMKRVRADTSIGMSSDYWTSSTHTNTNAQ